MAPLALGSEGGEETYYSAPDPTILRHFIDEGTIVWVRYFDSDRPRAELWASPLARSPAGLLPRLVHANAGVLHARYGEGVYLSVEGIDIDFVARLVDVADGRVRVLGVPEPAADPTVGCLYAHYVSRTEVLLQCGDGEVIYYRIDPRTLPYEG